jgi:hypothetical protein
MKDDYLFVPYFLLTPYDSTFFSHGGKTEGLILDRCPFLFVLDHHLKPVRTLFIDDHHYCFSFGFAVTGNAIFASNLMVVSRSRLPVFSKYSISDHELKSIGESKIEFSKSAYKGKMLTFVNTSFGRHPVTGKLLFCDTRRIAELESEKIFADPIFPDSDTSGCIMNFDFIAKDENKLQLLIDRIDSSWAHHYSIARYSIPEKRMDFIYQLGTTDSIKAFTFYKSDLYTLELEGENYIFKKYEMVQ